MALQEGLLQAIEPVDLPENISEIISTKENNLPMNMNVVKSLCQSLTEDSI